MGKKQTSAAPPACTILPKLMEPILCHLRVRCGHLFLKIMANDVPIHPYYSILDVRRKKEVKVAGEDEACLFRTPVKGSCSSVVTFFLILQHYLMIIIIIIIT